MDLEVCAQCGGEIEGQGVLFRQHRFCSDECCDEFEEGLLDVGDPGPAELEEAADFEDLDGDDGFDSDLDLDDEDEVF